MSIRNGLLALLSDGPEYGFALKKQFEERTAELWPLNVGQIYTTLGRLERDGLITEHASHDDGPVSDAAQRRYRITDAGREELREWMATPGPRDAPRRDELVIKLVLAVDLPDVDALGVVDDQRAVTTTALQELTRVKARLTDGDIGRQLAVDAAVTELEAELRWLDLCEARLAQAAARGRDRR